MDNQIYKAPSIPKINKTTISSPFNRLGKMSSNVLFKKSSFSFINPIRRQVDLKNLGQTSVENTDPNGKKSSETENKTNNLNLRKLIESVIEKSSLIKKKLTKPITDQTKSIKEELNETNKVLLEIQRQLTLDFSQRIAEEKKAINREKKRISAQKVADKESGIEKGTKNIFSKTFDTVTAPFKSIFQKLIDFFSIILTGILLNNAFEWLSKEENQQKVKAFFNFITEYWKELLIIFAAYKLLKLVKAIVGVATTLRRMLKWFKGFSAPKGPKPPGATPRGTPILPGKPLGRMTSSYDRFIQGTSNFGDRLRLLNRRQIGLSGLFTKGGFNESGQLRGQSLKLPSNIAKSGSSTLESSSSNIAKGRGIGRGGSLTVALLIAEIFKKPIQDMVGKLYNNIGIGYGNLSNEVILKQYKQEMEDYEKSSSTFKQIPGGESLIESPEDYNFGRLRMLQDEVKRRGLKYSQGGTVGQGDRAGTDTVPAQTSSGKLFLDTGEEVIRTSSAMLFRPLLKDINENAGRMWQQFTQAVIKLIEITGIQKDNAKIFKQVIDNYNKFLKEQIQKMKLKELENMGGGGPAGGTGTMPSTYASTTPMSSPTVPNIHFSVNKEGDNPQINLNKEGDNSQINISPTIVTTEVSTPKIPSVKLTPVAPVVNNLIINSSSSGKPNINVMSLPPVMESSQSKVPTYPAKSNEVPNILPFDVFNPWLRSESIYERYSVTYGI